MPEPARLTEATLPPEPLELFAAWIGDAEASGMTDPNAMTLATAGADGRPSARTVLLRGVGDDGFRFFTNRTSLKGRQLAENPRAQLLFFWREIGRQILIHGKVDQLSDAESDAYFASRARESQLGAWASEQGSVIESRDALLAGVAEAEQRFEGEEVQRPPHWGGYIVRPEAIEFWQAGEFRLHDRFVYRQLDDRRWVAERLSP
ncbi:MAG: pyridoxamine 5'-phosphate oxidase [Actinomycetes bacterium]